MKEMILVMTLVGAIAVNDATGEVTVAVVQ